MPMAYDDPSLNQPPSKTVKYKDHIFDLRVLSKLPSNARSRDMSNSNNASTNDLLNWSLLENAAIVEQCRTALREDGAMIIRNFASPEGIRRLKDEILSCPYNESTQHYTCWQDQGDDTYPPSHPRNFKIRASASFVGRKSLEESRDRLGISIYEDDRLLCFLSEVSTKPLYRSTDENGSVYSYRIHEKHNAPWHFDESPYTAIIYLQNSENNGGGEFEYVPWCRPTLDKNDSKGHDIVRQVQMEGKVDKVRSIQAESGTLIFFSGAHSFHRAAPVTDPTTVRLGLVFTFGLDADFSNSDSVHAANEWNPSNASCLILKAT